MTQPPGNMVLAVNLQLLVACVCGFGAWALWPQSPEWWGLGVTSVMLGMACVGGIANALRFAWTAYSKAKVIAEYRAQGADPKTAALASRERLRQAGMIDE